MGFRNDFGKRPLFAARRRPAAADLGQRGQRSPSRALALPAAPAAGAFDVAGQAAGWCAGLSQARELIARLAKRRTQNRAGISTAPARARCSAALRKSRRPAATPGGRSPAPLPPIFCTASTVENSKPVSIPGASRRSFSVRLRSQKKSLQATVAQPGCSPGFLIFVSKFPPRFFQISFPNLAAVFSSPAKKAVPGAIGPIKT